MAKSKILIHLENLRNGNANKVTITALTYFEAVKYSINLGIKIPPGTRLILTRDTVRHLANAGHLTGVGKHGRVDPNALSEEDLMSLPKIFKQPDIISVVGRSRFGIRIKVEKRLINHHRLILELEAHHKYFRLVSFFNINK